MPKPISHRGPIKIGMIGSRRRDEEVDFTAAFQAWKKLHKPGDWLVSGGCPEGGDAFAERIARAYGVTILIHHADWNDYNKQIGPKAKKVAGFVRNTDIAVSSDIIIAVCAKDRTGGTEDTVKKALSMGKKVIIV